MRYIPYTFSPGQRVQSANVVGRIVECFPDGIAHVSTADGRMLAIPVASLMPIGTKADHRRESQQDAA
jgi:hypothetical protein